MPLETNPSITSVATNAWDAVSEGATSVGRYVSSGFNDATSSLNETITGLTSGGSLSGFSGNGTSGSSLQQTASSLVGGDLSTFSDAVGSVPGLSSIASGVSSAFADIAGAAGAVNDFIGSLTGQSLPTGAELFAGSGTPIKLDSTSADDWRVRIKTQFSYFNSPMFKRLEETDGVVFPILPTVNLSTSANYSNIDPTHNNYPFPAYKNSQVDDISISGTFPAETAADAAYWLSSVQFFKTMTKMFFGQGENAGNPPPVCYLYGYGTHMFDKVPCVIKNFSVDLPEDVNYVKCTAYGNPTWVPISSTISVTVQPVYNRTNLRQFSLKDYAAGNMISPTGVRYL